MTDTEGCITVLEHVYTFAGRGFGAVPGIQTVAMTQGLEPVFRSKLEQLAVYDEPPREPGVPEPASGRESRSEHVAWHYQSLSQERVVLSHTMSTGNFGERGGNYLAHSLVMTRAALAALPSPGLPLLMNPSLYEREKWGPEREPQLRAPRVLGAAELMDAPGREVLRSVNPLELLLQIGNDSPEGAFAWLVERAWLAATNPMRALVLLLPSWCFVEDGWVALLVQAIRSGLPPGLRDALTYRTYTVNPYQYRLEKRWTVSLLGVPDRSPFASHIGLDETLFVLGKQSGRPALPMVQAYARQVAAEWARVVKAGRGIALQGTASSITASTQSLGFVEQFGAAFEQEYARAEKELSPAQLVALRDLLEKVQRPVEYLEHLQLLSRRVAKGESQSVLDTFYHAASEETLLSEPWTQELRCQYLEVAFALPFSDPARAMARVQSVLARQALCGERGEVLEALIRSIVALAESRRPFEAGGPVDRMLELAASLVGVGPGAVDSSEPAVADETSSERIPSEIIPSEIIPSEGTPPAEFMTAAQYSRLLTAWRRLPAGEWDRHLERVLLALQDHPEPELGGLETWQLVLRHCLWLDRARTEAFRQMLRVIGDHLVTRTTDEHLAQVIAASVKYRRSDEEPWSPGLEGGNRGQGAVSLWLTRIIRRGLAIMRGRSESAILRLYPSSLAALWQQFPREPGSQAYATVLSAVIEGLQAELPLYAWPNLPLATLMRASPMDFAEVMSSVSGVGDPYVDQWLTHLGSQLVSSRVASDGECAAVEVLRLLLAARRVDTPERELMALKALPPVSCLSLEATRIEVAGWGLTWLSHQLARAEVEGATLAQELLSLETVLDVLSMLAGSLELWWEHQEVRSRLVQRAPQVLVGAYRRRLHLRPPFPFTLLPALASELRTLSAVASSDNERLRLLGEFSGVFLESGRASWLIEELKRVDRRRLELVSMRDVLEKLQPVLMKIAVPSPGQTGPLDWALRREALEVGLQLYSDANFRWRIPEAVRELLWTVGGAAALEGAPSTLLEVAEGNSPWELYRLSWDRRVTLNAADASSYVSLARRRLAQHPLELLELELQAVQRWPEVSRGEFASLMGRNYTIDLATKLGEKLRAGLDAARRYGVDGRAIRLLEIDALRAYLKISARGSHVERSLVELACKQLWEDLRGFSGAARGRDRQLQESPVWWIEGLGSVVSAQDPYLKQIVNLIRENRQELEPWEEALKDMMRRVPALASLQGVSPLTEVVSEMKRLWSEAGAGSMLVGKESSARGVMGQQARYPSLDGALAALMKTLVDVSRQIEYRPRTISFQAGTRRVEWEQLPTAAEYLEVRNLLEQWFRRGDIGDGPLRRFLEILAAEPFGLLDGWASRLVISIDWEWGLAMATHEIHLVQQEPRAVGDQRQERVSRVVREVELGVKSEEKRSQVRLELRRRVYSPLLIDNSATRDERAPIGGSVSGRIGTIAGTGRKGPGGR